MEVRFLKALVQRGNLSVDLCTRQAALSVRIARPDDVPVYFDILDRWPVVAPGQQPSIQAICGHKATEVKLSAFMQSVASGLTDHIVHTIVAWLEYSRP